MVTKIAATISAVTLLAILACTQHKVEVAPVKVEPIHITIDVNVKVDMALDDFFDEIDAEEEKIEQQATQ